MSRSIGRNFERMFLLVLFLGLSAAEKITSDYPGIVISSNRRLVSLNTSFVDLDLSGLGLRTIHSNAFQNCASARSLDLSNNSISDLPEGVFSPLTNLENLSLANNNIGGRSTRRAFLGLAKLKSLDITNNRLARVLDKENFAGLTKSCDIFISGSKEFRIISPLAFGKRTDRPSGVDEVVNQTSTNTDIKCSQPVSLYIELQLDTKEPEIDSSVRVEMCTVGDKLEFIDVHDMNATLPRTCVRLSIEPEKPKLMIVETGIKSFERGWFRIRDLPFNSIYIHHNRIDEVTSELLNDLPENIKYFSVQRSNLERLSKGVIVNEHLRGLDFSQNAINYVEEDTFIRTNLTHLDLGSNYIKSIKFTPTLPTSLLDLDLQLNGIDEIPADSFAHLKNLLGLRLCHNNITELQPRSLSGLESLQTLELCYANLAKLQPDVFRDLGKLGNLDLYANDLRSLDKGTLNGLVCLAELDLNSNKFTRFDKDMLHGVTEHFDRMFLQFNELESLEAASFVKVPKSELWLNSNKISNIDRDAFDLPYLRRLSLDSNNLTTIAKGTTRKVGCLGNDVYIKLTSNPIKRLENGALAGLPSEAKVYLDGTPIEVIQAGVFEDV